MSESLDKLFAITSEPLCPVDQTRSEFREDRLAAMRIGRETAWRRYREAEGDKTEALAKAGDFRKKVILEMIAVADEFEGALQVFLDSKKLKKQKEAHAFFKQLFDSLCHALEQVGVYRVDLEGKSYHQVSYKGLAVPQPWEVVGVDGKKPESAKDGIAKRVLRSLWVYHVGKDFFVLRRGQVYY